MDDVISALDAISPGELDHDQWLHVGMALAFEGYPCEVWDEWSSRGDPRYRQGECERRWRSFRGGGGSPRTRATIFALAMERGWTKPRGDAAPESGPWEQAARFLRALYRDGESVSVVTAARRDGGRYRPADAGRTYDRTELARAIERRRDVGGALGQRLNDKAGAWIRVNPTAGAHDDEVTDYRYVLVESDSIPRERQLEIIRRMNLPCAALVDSGGKSIHAVVHVDAGHDRQLYDQRVRQVYEACNEAELSVDHADKNPARLMRLPGVARGREMQRLIDVNVGATSFDAWARSREAGMGAGGGGRKAPLKVHELVEAVECDQALAGFSYNVLTHAPYVTGPLPWGGTTGRRWDQYDDAALYAYMQERVRVGSRQDLTDAFLIACRRREYNPLQDMLMRELTDADGMPIWVPGRDPERADRLFVDTLGAEDTPYTRAVTRLALDACMQRAMSPGVKYDNCVILFGPQGIGKSYLLRLLAMRDEFFTDSLSDVSDPKASGELIVGKWIVEMAELAAVKGREAENVKMFISKQVDEFRPAYGKVAVEFPRSCAIFGTTNSRYIMRDRTGNRRYLPITCAVNPPTVDLFGPGATEYVRMVWGEVYARWCAGGAPRLVLPEGIAQLASDVREEFEAGDSVADLVTEWVARSGDGTITIRRVCEEALGMRPEQIAANRGIYASVGEVLDGMPGLEKGGRHRVGGGNPQRTWSRMVCVRE